MKLSIKNIVAGIVLLMGMVLFYDPYFDSIDVSSKMEINSDNDRVSDIPSAELDFNEDEKIGYLFQFHSLVKIITNVSHFHVCLPAQQPFLSVWQPPKLS